MVSLHILVEEYATQIQAVHTKKKEQNSTGESDQESNKIFRRPSRMRITNCFIINVQRCILPFQGGGLCRYCNTEKGYRKKIIVKKITCIINMYELIVA